MTDLGADVLIVGLGPGGAAMAIRLARAGLRVTAIDRAVFPREKICSEFLNPETVRQLELLGVADQLRGIAVPLHGARVFGVRGNALTGLFGETPGARHQPGMSIPRRILDHTLVEHARAAGVEVIVGCRLVDLLREGDRIAGGVVARGDRTEAIRARITIGADGLHSVMARLLGGRIREPLRRYGFVAHVAEVPDVGFTAEMHVGRGLYVGLNTIAPGLTNVAVVASRRTVAAAPGDPTRFWAEAIARFPALCGRVRTDRIERPVLTSGPFATRSRRLVANGALLIGDAAGFFDPFTGEGVCTALREAELAAPVVVEALGMAATPTAAHLDPYQTLRRRAFAGKWAVERLIGYGMLAPALFDRAVGRLERRGMSHTLIGVTGEILPARAVLNAGFLMAVML